jgi:hypothetical protein
VIQREDAFIVIATDGVWEVMENSEVVNFVEAYRSHCRRGNYTREPTTERTQPSNASIAQLLCEEARMRWLAIVEGEDVLVNDISAVIIEFSDSNAKIIPFISAQIPNIRKIPNPFTSLKNSFEALHQDLAHKDKGRF